MHVNILTIFILVQAKYNSKEPTPICRTLKLNHKSRWGKEKLIVDFSLKLIDKKCGLYIYELGLSKTKRAFSFMSIILHTCTQKAHACSILI